MLRRSDPGEADVLLENRNAVVHGAGGPVGRAVAGAFAREGAMVFLAGRTAAPLEPVAAEIATAGGRAETAVVDTLDEESVDRHADDVAQRAGSIDVVFNAVGHGDVHGPTLMKMPYEDFARPVDSALRSLFLTTRAAARHMIPKGSGVVLTITATTAHKSLPQIGGTGVRFDAMESLCRQWATELGPHGIRVGWLQTTGLPEAIRYPGPFPDYGTGAPMTRDEMIEWNRDQTMLGRLTTLADVGNTAAFLASDQGSAFTAAAANITCGLVPTR
jgi:NAD(P)-dependent dehydrogenase (short-subunit alcohol dehydrogenase family)